MKIASPAIRKIFWIIVLSWPVLVQAEPKVMQYNTGIPWSDGDTYLNGNAIPIGSDFLAVLLTESDNRKLYVLDLKKSKLALKIDRADIRCRYVKPSGTTSSFILEYENASGEACVSLYTYNKNRRTWGLAADTTARKVTTGYAAAPSTLLLPGYFVNTVRRSGILWLDVYKY